MGNLEQHIKQSIYKYMGMLDLKLIYSKTNDTILLVKNIGDDYLT